MKKKWPLVIGLILVATGCTVRLNFLGEDRMQEVVLIKSPAKEKVLVIDLEGMIGPLGQDGILNREGDVLSRVYARLQRAAEDRSVRGVILRLDTPGGDVTSSDILYREVVKFKERTGLPVVALMMGVAASGGYYVASACDAVVAHPSTITGSIGVISLFPDMGGLLSKVGVKMQVIKSGELKDAGSPFRDLSEKEQRIFQEIIDELYERFLSVVHESRKGSLSLEEIRNLADGRIYTAAQALKLKLIDEVGYFDDALQRVLEKGKIPAAQVVAYTYYPKRQNNLYAAKLENPSFFEQKSLADLMPTLRSGFYYLWLPQMKTD
ncbi:MAG: signal peptide peptidase SppA [Candidatus Aminicenantes bacterium]|nr:signal peptide peptidase SppA [Candidatus Aminicenantes bacterium]